MANVIKLKNSGTANSAPTSLETGELAINYADGKIFYKNSSNAVVEFASAEGVTVSDNTPSSPSAGDLWYESDTGKTFIYYDSFWVEIGNGSALAPNSIVLGTDTTGNYMSGVSVQNGLTVSHTPAEGSSATIGVDNALLGNFLLDGASGNSYGLIGTSAYLDVKNTNGYNKEIELDIVALETKLDTDGYITSTAHGSIDHSAVMGTVVLDDINDVTAPTPSSGDFLKWNGTAWVNDPINLGTDTVGNYMSDVSAGTGIAVSHTPGEGSTATISIESTAWTAYTPTISADGGGFALNNGTLTGRYKQIGKTVFFKLKFVFGSTTNAGSGHWNFSLPVTAYDSDFTFSASILDSGVAWYGGIGNGNYTGSTTTFAVNVTSPNAAVATWVVVGNGGPFSWGAADNITITGSYEAA